MATWGRSARREELGLDLDETGVEPLASWGDAIRRVLEIHVEHVGAFELGMGAGAGAQPPEPVGSLGVVGAHVRDEVAQPSPPP